MNRRWPKYQNRQNTLEEIIAAGFPPKIEEKVAPVDPKDWPSMTPENRVGSWAMCDSSDLSPPCPEYELKLEPEYTELQMKERDRDTTSSSGWDAEKFSSHPNPPESATQEPNIPHDSALDTTRAVQEEISECHLTENWQRSRFVDIKQDSPNFAEQLDSSYTWDQQSNKPTEPARPRFEWPNSRGKYRPKPPPSIPIESKTEKNNEIKNSSFEFPIAAGFTLPVSHKDRDDERKKETEKSETDMNQLETPLEDAWHDTTEWSNPEVVETSVESNPEVLNVMSTLPDAGEWPDPPMSRLSVPDDYDENPNVAKFLTNVFRKLRTRDAEVDSCHGNPCSTESANYSSLSIEVGDMDSDDNKFEVSELIEYKDLSWCIAVPIDKERTNDKNVYQHLVYSYQVGIDRVFLDSEQTAELKNTLMIKYRKVNDKMEVVPIYSALPSTGLISLKYRHNKGIEMRVYGIVNFIDFLKDPNCSQRQTTVWTDALGPLYLTPADRSNFRRKLMGTEEKVFAPLRMCMMTVKGEFNLNVANGYIPRWSVTSFQPLFEEGPKDPNIGRNLWPARIIRFDDLVLLKMVRGEVQQSCNDEFLKKNGSAWLRSYSNPDVRVFAGVHLSGVLQSAGPEYTNNGIMMGIVVPFFIKNEFSHYEALIVGPPRVVMILTEGRFLNYCPKTWSPKIEAMQKKYQKIHDLKKFVREEPPWKPPHESVKQMKSMRGFHEFHFEFAN